MENEDEILSALQKAVTAAVAASDAPALPVSYLMVEFATPADQKWLEIVWIPNNRTGDFLGDEMNHRGILRLVLHWPNVTDGAYAPIRLLGSIARYFTPGRLLSGVQVSAKPNFGGMVGDEDDNLFPVSIAYHSYRKGA